MMFRGQNHFVGMSPRAEGRSRRTRWPRTSSFLVIPAKAGIQAKAAKDPRISSRLLDSRFRGNDGVGCLSEVDGRLSGVFWRLVCPGAPELTRVIEP
jgi:hypothetical protein